MAKPQLIDGVFYRERRGKLVAIPKQWFGKTTTKKTIRDRKSAAVRKKRTRGQGNIKGSGY